MRYGIPLNDQPEGDSLKTQNLRRRGQVAKAADCKSAIVGSTPTDASLKKVRCYTGPFSMSGLKYKHDEPSSESRSIPKKFTANAFCCLYCERPLGTLIDANPH